jgi:site-specific recombinase XerD
MHFWRLRWRRSKAQLINVVIEAYLSACDAEGKSPRTISAYGETLRQFMDVVTRRGLSASVDGFTSQDVYSFLQAVSERGVSLATRHRRYREVRAFFSWCERMGMIERNPFSGIPNVRQEQKVVQPFTPDEIGRLLSVCVGDTEYDARNKAIILVLLDTGLRSSELRQLEMQDVDLESGRIQVRYAKGRRQRVVSASNTPCEALNVYLNKYRGLDPGRVFLTTREREYHSPINPYLLGNLFRKLGERSGVRANPHRFRHTFATWAIEAGAQEIDVQYLMGHSTSVMVRRYSSTYDANKAALNHASFSPVARL